MLKEYVKKAFSIFFIVIITLMSFLQSMGCSAPAQNIKVTLIFSDPPVLGKEVEVTATFALSGNVYKQALGVTAQIILPEGIEKVAGDLQYQGDFLLGNTYELKAIVKTIKTGAWKIEAKAFFSPGEGAYLGGTRELWVNVSAQDATVSERPPKPTGIPKISSVDPPTARASSSAIIATLAFSDPSVLGKEVELVATFTLSGNDYKQARDVTAQITLPEGIEKLSGNLQYQGDFLLGNTYELKATVKTIKTGLWKIEAKAFFSPGEGAYMGGTREVWVNVSEKEAIMGPTGALPVVGLVSRTNSPKGFEEDVTEGTALQSIPLKRAITPEQIPSPFSSSEDGGKGLLTSSLIITGGFKCLISENNVPMPNVVRADIEEPMIWGSVFAYNARTHTFLGAAVTGMGTNAGIFSITVENPYPDGFYLWVVPESSVAEVKDGENSYVLTPPSTWYPQESQGNINVGWFTIGDTYPEYTDAWRIYETMSNDAFNRGAYYFLYLNGFQMPCVRATYPDETPFVDGAWYNEITQILHIKYSYETKALDTVLHEYGHRVWHEVQGSFTTYWGHLTHYFGEAYDPGQVFEEDWGNFFAMAVQDDPVYEWGDGPQLNLETQGWNDTYGWPNGDNVEGRVSGALWDLIDSNNDGYQGHLYDQIDTSFVTIWSIFSDSTPETTFTEFWSHLKNSFLPDQVPAARALFQNTIPYSELRLYVNTISNPSNGGSVTKNPSSSNYPRYQQVSLTANPTIGYHFNSWSGNAHGSYNPAQLTMDFDKNVTANFAINTYTLTYTAGSGGTIIGTSPQTVDYGGSGTAVTPVPNTGYHFVN